jgi:hypothetical protein
MPLKKQFMIILLTAGLISCKSGMSNKTYGEGKDCKVFFDYVKRSWKKKGDGFFENTEKTLYDEDLPVPYRFPNPPCLLGLSKKQIVNLFGEPSKKETDRFDYYMYGTCDGKDNYGCIRLKIFFDERSRVDSVPQLLMMEYGPTK